MDKDCNEDILSINQFGHNVEEVSLPHRGSSHTDKGCQTAVVRVTITAKLPARLIKVHFNSARSWQT